jgi:hypothetical protein
MKSKTRSKYTVWNFNTEMFITLTQVPNIAKTTIKFTFKKTSGSSSTKFVFIHAFHTLFHGRQQLIHETAGLFSVKSEIHRKNIL